MQFNCKCGGCSIYLKRKGSTEMVGAYCMDCGAWVKWVGKKDVNNLSKQGFIVHPESYVSPTIKIKQEQLAKDKELLQKVTNVTNGVESTSVKSVENIELNLSCKNCGKQEIENVTIRKVSGTHTGVYCACCGSWIKWLGKKELAYLISTGVEIQETEEKAKNVKLKSNSTEDEYREDVFNEDYFADYTDSDEEEQDIETEEIVAKTCEFCNGLSSLYPIIDSKVNLTYFDGVLSIIDETETELLGSYKMAYCPRCGRKLSKK